MAENKGNNGVDRNWWLWRWGVASWLLLGIIGAVVVLYMGYGRAHSVLLPLIVAVIIGVLLEPFVDLLVRWHLPRWLAAVITLILIVAVVAGFMVIVIYGVSSQSRKIGRQVDTAVNKIQKWFERVSVSRPAVKWVQKEVEKAWPAITDGLTKTLTSSASGLVSFAVGLFIGFFILLFLLSDDGTIREFLSGHMGVPKEMGDSILEEVVGSFRGYFRGATIVAAVNAIVVIPVVLILRVPLLGAIVLVTFVTCYIPSFGGYIGGAFAVFVTLAARGLTPALIMLVFSIIAHTILQAPVQAIAYGKTLQLHPLLALLVTLFGAVFAGIAGAILAVPLTAVVIKVVAEVKRAQAAEGLIADAEPSSLD